jgi:hypothetical protein
MAAKPQDEGRGWRNIDGAVFSALMARGYTELCHLPSLVMHAAGESTLGTPKRPEPESFRGEDWDVRELVAQGIVPLRR